MWATTGSARSRKERCVRASPPPIRRCRRRGARSGSRTTPRSTGPAMSGSRTRRRIPRRNRPARRAAIPSPGSPACSGRTRTARCAGAGTPVSRPCRKMAPPPARQRGRGRGLQGRGRQGRRARDALLPATVVPAGDAPPSIADSGASPLPVHAALPVDDLREPEVVGRVWIAPFVDADGIYREGAWVRLVIEPARWRLR